MGSFVWCVTYNHSLHIRLEKFVNRNCNVTFTFQLNRRLPLKCFNWSIIPGKTTMYKIFCSNCSVIIFFRWSQDLPIHLYWPLCGSKDNLWYLHEGLMVCSSSYCVVFSTQLCFIQIKLRFYIDCPYLTWIG